MRTGRSFLSVLAVGVMLVACLGGAPAASAAGDARTFTLTGGWFCWDSACLDVRGDTTACHDTEDPNPTSIFGCRAYFYGGMARNTTTCVTGDCLFVSGLTLVIQDSNLTTVASVPVNFQGAYWQTGSSFTVNGTVSAADSRAGGRSWSGAGQVNPSGTFSIVVTGVQ